MKRSDFLKSLRGIALGVILAPAIISDPFDILKTKPAYPCEGSISTMWTSLTDFEQGGIIYNDEFHNIELVRNRMNEVIQKQAIINFTKSLL